MKYLALAFVAVANLVCVLLADMYLTADEAERWSEDSTLILIVIFFMAVGAHASDRKTS